MIERTMKTDTFTQEGLRDRSTHYKRDAEESPSSQNGVGFKDENLENLHSNIPHTELISSGNNPNGEINCSMVGSSKNEFQDGQNIHVKICNERGEKSIFSLRLPKWLQEPEVIIPESVQTGDNCLPDSEDGNEGEFCVRCHKNADSLLSSDSGFTNYRGFLNLCMILLAMSVGRVALENVIKYGILVDPFRLSSAFLYDPYNWPSLLLVLSSNLFILLAYELEVLMSKRVLHDSVGRVVHFINLAAVIIFPAIVVLYFHPNPVFSSMALSVYAVTFLKLISYKQVNTWLRDSYFSSENQIKVKRKRLMSSSGRAKMNGTHTQKEDDEKLEENKQHYPENLYLKDIYYFMLAPTLCYELNFPRSSRIRKRFLLKRIFEMIFLSGLIASLVQQWVVPTVFNSMKPFANMEVPRIVERLLKLALPNHFIWLIFFYWFFHSCLNVMAELLRFGDRVFYRDWWNAESITYFWQNWNIPVHKWASRHLYKPLLKKGFTKLQGVIAVFLVSAFFHEYLVSVPLRMFRLWAFGAMVAQIPMAIVTQKWIKGKWGNIVVWLSLIAGQPVAILMYYHDYFVMSKT